MNFDFFWDYVAFGLFLPIFCTILFAVATLFCFKILRKWKQRGKTFRKRIKIWILTLFFIFVMVQYVSVIVSGSYHLLYEREHDAVTVSGQITEIAPTNRFPTFSADYANSEEITSSGVDITVDGKALKGHNCIYAGYSKGDSVTVTYLPNSGYILKIVKN